MVQKISDKQKKELRRLDQIVEMYGGDKGTSNVKETAVWLKKAGYPSLAELISNE